MTSGELIEWRKRNNCSQGILADVLGIDVITVSRWERDVQKLPPFLHYALKHIEQKGDMIMDAIERRAFQRRNGTERRMSGRSSPDEATVSEKRASHRRTSERRSRKKAVID
jgi:transcriptional regulator with XRE-family HTH domain